MQPKNVQQHEKVQKASTEGVAIQGQQGTRLLPEQLIKEAFILSDLFDIGELAAVELLLAGRLTFNWTCGKVVQNYKVIHSGFKVLYHLDSKVVYLKNHIQSISFCLSVTNGRALVIGFVKGNLTFKIGFYMVIY